MTISSETSRGVAPQKRRPQSSGHGSMLAFAAPSVESPFRVETKSRSATANHALSALKAAAGGRRSRPADGLAPRLDRSSATARSDPFKRANQRTTDRENCIALDRRRHRAFPGRSKSHPPPLLKTPLNRSTGELPAGRSPSNFHDPLSFSSTRGATDFRRGKCAPMITAWLMPERSKVLSNSLTLLRSLGARPTNDHVPRAN